VGGRHLPGGHLRARPAAECFLTETADGDHTRAVLGLSPAEQKRLLDQAEAKGWTTRQLEDKAASVSKGQRTIAPP
jgi:hypothetical protein